MEMVHPLEKNICRVLLPKEKIMERIAYLGQKISQELNDEELVVICVLKGAMPFMADLVRHITVPVVTDYVALSSYGGSTKSSGVVRFQKDIEEDISGRNVLVVEDIIDSGLTLHYLLETLNLRNPKSLKVCCLVDKPARRKTDVKVDYLGFTIDDHFIVGYGMDYDESYRNIDYIGILDPSAI